METAVSKFTAAQIATALGKTPQAVRKQLKDLSPSGTVIRGGLETASWTRAALPEALRGELDAAARRQRYHDADALLLSRDNPWQPALPLSKIDEREIHRAKMLQGALLPFVTNADACTESSADFFKRGVEVYFKIFGHTITERHWRRLYDRTIERDAGNERWTRLEIFLPDNPKPKAAPIRPMKAKIKKLFQEIGDYIETRKNPVALNEYDLSGLWVLAFQKYDSLTNSGCDRKKAARLVRDYLFSAAPQLARSRNALRLAFNCKLERWQKDKSNPLSTDDGRARNGDRADYPSKDVRIIRHSAVLKNGRRIDAAWREEYRKLSEYTQQRHEPSVRCPRPLAQLVNRIKVDALFAYLQGKRELRKLIGGVTRNAEGIPAMAIWSADDMTSNIEVFLKNSDGTISLICPQIVAVMDFASRKWVGWAMSTDKGPTARLVCTAVLDGFKRHKVPSRLNFENGFVFGKSLNVNGKEDEQGRSVVAGLGRYGCSIGHFEKDNPTSKAELEQSFHLVQRLMERHPGYTGRNQMLDAPENFKREKRLINSGKVPPEKFRYSYEEFPRVMAKLVDGYNSAPQHYGHLGGLSPNEAFEALQPKDNPPINLNELEWLLADERYLVEVKPGGVKFSLYGEPVEVRGGELPQHIGNKLWALVDRDDSSAVTFMSLDYANTFSVEACQRPSAAQSLIASGSTVLANERRKIHEHKRAIGDELKDLQNEFGNPRLELLKEIRSENSTQQESDCSTRRLIINPRITESYEKGRQQREDIKKQKRQRTANGQRAQRLGIPRSLMDDNENAERAMQLLETPDDAEPQ